MSRTYPLFVKRDLDGFCGLFVDNLIQLLTILTFCRDLCGMSGDQSGLIYDRILPGAAVSILAGNLFYAWLAHRLAKREGRSDVTALPYGINTPSLIVYVLFVMAPIYRQTGSAEAAWLMGLIACLGSGVIELAGAFVAGAIRRSTPRAALLSTLAGIAIGFISMSFALEIYQRPLVGLLPFALLLVSLFARTRFPLGLPGGFVAVACGTGLAWLLTLVRNTVPDAPGWLTYGAMDPSAVRAATDVVGFRLPMYVGDRVWELVQSPERWLPYLSVIVPMGLFNVIGSLQNIESAEAGGDRFPTAPAMAANGIGTILAALFGSCFPTTIYIGHPGWKGLGARAGYSTLNGLFITLICLGGLVAWISAIVPMQAGAAIILWIGIIITAQAFQATHRAHAPAVAVGLFPAIAAWGATVMMGCFFTAGGQTLQSLIEPVAATGNPPPLDANVNGFLVHGLLLIERGYIFTCTILAAIGVCLIERKFFAAAAWSFAAAALTWIGVLHAYQLQGNTLDFLFRFAEPEEGALLFRGDAIAITYLLWGLLFLALGRFRDRLAVEDAPGH